MSNMPRTATINLRVSDATRDLIDRAAAVQGKSRSEFMLDAARREAEDALLDRRLFALDANAFELFKSQLDAPMGEDALARLARTMKGG